MTTYQWNGQPCTADELAARMNCSVEDLDSMSRIAPESPKPKYRDPLPEDSYYDQDESFGWILEGKLYPPDEDAISEAVALALEGGSMSGFNPVMFVSEMRARGFTIVK